MRSRHIGIAATLGLVAGIVLGLFLPEWTTTFVRGRPQLMITTEDIFFGPQPACERERPGGIMKDTPVIVRRHGPTLLISTSYFVIDYTYRPALRPLSDSEKSIGWSELFCETLRDPNSTNHMACPPSGQGEPSGR